MTLQNHFVFDVEADGPCPGLYSMVSFAVVSLTDDTIFFKGETAPITEMWLPEALAVSGIDRDQHVSFPTPAETMAEFAGWVDRGSGGGRPVLWSDNPAFDWQFLNYYLHRFVGHNPFGFSARRIGDFYAGLERRPRDATGWKKLRRTRHSHDPLDDARGNAEALRELLRRI